MPEYKQRRIVTGLDENGRSSVIFDGAGGFVQEALGLSVTLLWQSDQTPASNAGVADAAADAYSFKFAKGATKLLVVNFEPQEGLIGPGLHATDTLDYGILLSGRISLELQTGIVDMAPGDIIVDRGVLHGWRNKGPEVATMLFVNVDALPVGSGATVNT